jgi:hypothetical protein
VLPLNEWSTPMPRFQILPTDPSLPMTEFVAADAVEVLIVVQRLSGKNADIWCDDTYAYSLRLDDNGLWHVFQREEVVEIKVTHLIQ